MPVIIVVDALYIVYHSFYLNIVLWLFASNLKWIIKLPKFSELIAVFHEEGILGINIPVSWDVLLIESCDEPGVLVHKLCCLQSGNYFLNKIYLYIYKLALDYTQTYLSILHNFIFIMGATFCKFCQPYLLTIPWGITESWVTTLTTQFYLLIWTYHHLSYRFSSLFMTWFAFPS